MDREHILGKDFEVDQDNLRIIGIELRHDAPWGNQEEFFMEHLDVVLPKFRTGAPPGSHRLTVTIHTNIGDRQGLIYL